MLPLLQQSTLTLIQATLAECQSSAGFPIRRHPKYNSPLLLLVYRAAGVHAANHNSTKIQQGTLLNMIKSLCPIVVKSTLCMRSHEGLLQFS
jgi:hypothetical protein